MSRIFTIEFFVTFEEKRIKRVIGAIYTSGLDRSEIDLSPKRSECEHSNAHCDQSKIDLN